jgi:hypothetical protein
MRKLLLAGVAYSAFAVGPALAADLAVRAPIYKAPPPVRELSMTMAPCRRPASPASISN